MATFIIKENQSYQDDGCAYLKGLPNVTYGSGRPYVKGIPDLTYVSGRNYCKGIQIRSMEAAASILK